MPKPRPVTRPAGRGGTESFRLLEISTSWTGLAALPQPTEKPLIGGSATHLTHLWSPSPAMVSESWDAASSPVWVDGIELMQVSRVAGLAFVGFFAGLVPTSPASAQTIDGALVQAYQTNPQLNA